jgi:hypothetical protein
VRVRGTVTAYLTDGDYRGAFVQVEATDSSPQPLVYFGLVDGRVRAMPRDDVSAATLNAARGTWKPYGRGGLVEDVWRYRQLTALPAKP